LLLHNSISLRNTERKDNFLSSGKSEAEKTMHGGLGMESSEADSQEKRA